MRPTWKDFFNIFSGLTTIETIDQTQKDSNSYLNIVKNTFWVLNGRFPGGNQWQKGVHHMGLFDYLLPIYPLARAAIVGLSTRKIPAVVRFIVGGILSLILLAGWLLKSFCSLIVTGLASITILPFIYLFNKNNTQPVSKPSLDNHKEAQSEDLIHLGENVLEGGAHLIVDSVNDGIALRVLETGEQLRVIFDTQSQQLTLNNRQIDPSLLQHSSYSKMLHFISSTGETTVDLVDGNLCVNDSYTATSVTHSGKSTTIDYSNSGHLVVADGGAVAVTGHVNVNITTFEFGGLKQLFFPGPNSSFGQAGIRKSTHPIQPSQIDIITSSGEYTITSSGEYQFGSGSQATVSSNTKEVSIGMGSGASLILEENANVICRSLGSGCNIQVEKGCTLTIEKMGSGCNINISSGASSVAIQKCGPGLRVSGDHSVLTLPQSEKRKFGYR